MSTTGQSASNTGDKLTVLVTPPAFPQSIDVLGVEGVPVTPLTGLGVGDLLIRSGFQVAGASAAKSV
jgi:hypothetical protein